jgi:uncharacterized protein
VLQQTGQSGQYGQGGHQGGYGQPYGGQQTPMGGGMMGGGMMGGGMMGGSGGGSFLGTAAAAAAGMVGGSLLLNSFRGMMGGSHQSFGDTGLAGRATSQSPWSDQSGSNLARDAGVNDIGSSGNRNDSSNAGLFDKADNQDNSDIDDDFGGNDDSDFA